MANNVEKRFLTNGFEVRTEEGKPTVVEGYAAVFNDETVIGGSFAERIDRNAFDGADMTNTVALFNHDVNKPLARAGHGLELSVDDRGLKYRFEVGNQSYAKDLVENIRLGNVSTSSFGFTVRDDEWEMRDEMNLRTIKEVGLLFDVSPTTQGAYPTTEVGLRSMELALENEGVLAAEEEVARMYHDKDKDEEEEEDEDRDEDEDEEEEKENKSKRSEEKDEEDCGCGDNEIKPVQREADQELETADAPVAEESDSIIQRGAESEISMNEEKNAPAVVQGLGDAVQNVRARFDLGKAIREAASGGLTGLEAEMSQEGSSEFRQGGVAPGTGINIPSMLLRADAAPMGTETVGTSGSETLFAGGAIATEVQGPVGRYRPVTFADKMGVRRITGVTGDISIPVQSDSITVSEKTNENDAQDSANMAFSSVTLSPDRISSHTKASQMLLAQNSFDLQAFLADDMRRGLENQYNTKLKGVIEGITEFDAGDNSLAKEHYAYKLEELLREGDVDPAGAFFLTEPTLYRDMRQATLDAGSGVFAATSASRIGEYEAIVSTLFTDGHAYLVKPEDLVVAEWGGLNLQVDPYTEAHLDVVRIIANMYVDCKILRAAGVQGIKP
jgi:HK97 family phage prohead protease/HK97 family phage major capsid protein